MFTIEIEEIEKAYVADIFLKISRDNFELTNSQLKTI